MQNHKVFLSKNHKKVDLGFFGLLFIFIIICVLVLGDHNTYDKSNKNIVPLDSQQQEKYNYDNFWHKFNSYAVIMINIKDKSSSHLISQPEVTGFQQKFFSNFNLTEEDDKTILQAGVPISPDVLFCYMSKYDPNKLDTLDIIKSCIKTPNLIK